MRISLLFFVFVRGIRLFCRDVDFSLNFSLPWQGHRQAMPPFQSGDFANKYLTILMLFYKQLNLFRPRMNAYAKALHNQVYLFILLYRRRRLCHNAEWSLRDASQASWQSRVFGYLGDCFSRCCSFAMTLRHSLVGRYPVISGTSWVPVFTGMTKKRIMQSSLRVTEGAELYH